MSFICKHEQNTLQDANSDFVSQRALTVKLSRVQQFFGSVFTQLASLFVWVEAEIAALVLSEDRLSRSTHATLTRDEARASSWLHSSPHLTLYVHNCKLYRAYFLFMKVWSYSTRPYCGTIVTVYFSKYFSFTSTINYSVCGYELAQSSVSHHNNFPTSRHFWSEKFITLETYPQATRLIPHHLPTLQKKKNGKKRPIR